MITKDSVKYVFHVIFHPFDGFWDLKHEKRGTVGAALLFLALWFITNIISQTSTGFMFDPDHDMPFNILKEFRSVFVFFLLFTAANWSVTTLMGGKGHYRDIVMVFGYASFPLTLLRIPAVLLSQYLTASEAVYYNILLGLAWGWFGFLLFIGIMMIHDYTMAKTIGTMVVTAVSIVLILFIYMVLYNIFSVIAAFVIAAYKEISIRF
ncbi:DUF1282 domain-containing protein [Candidatus Nomurabacteria bacterium]|nr:DUF1282 domain-containing protein [Candidatus Nomurabacteria bacterium]